MSVVTVQDAKTHLSRLLERVRSGEQIIIAKGKVPVARLVPVDAAPPTGRVFGAARGCYGEVPDGFFEPLADAELAEWEDHAR